MTSKIDVRITLKRIYNMVSRNKDRKKNIRKFTRYKVFNLTSYSKQVRNIIEGDDIFRA